MRYHPSRAGHEDFDMKTIVALVYVTAGVLMSNLASSAELARSPADARLAQANPGRVCAQVISCGTKNGKRREYPTPCAAQDDGATNIAPRTGPTCDDSK
jgi:hypothetical protein